MAFIKSNYIKLVFKSIVSVVLLVLVFRYIGLNKVYNEILSAKPSYIALSVLITFFPIYFMAARWKNIISLFKVNINLKSSVYYTFISTAFGLITPGRLGQFIKVKYLANDTKISYPKSFVTVIIDKAFDIAILILLALMGSLFIGNIIWHKLLITAFIFYIIILVMIFIYYNKFFEIVGRFLPNKFKSGLKNINIDRQLYIKSLLLSLSIWAVYILQAFFILKALDVSKLPIYIITSLVPLMALSSIIPISIGGIGVREIISIYFLSAMNIQAEKSAVFSLIYTFIGAGLPAIIGAALYVKEKLS